MFFQALQILDLSEVQSQLGLSPHNIVVSHTLPPLDTRSRPPGEFMENLLEVMTKILPDQALRLLPDHSFKIQVEERDVFVEVTCFEPMQEILVSWNLKVCFIILLFRKLRVNIEFFVVFVVVVWLVLLQLL